MLLASAPGLLMMIDESEYIVDTFRPFNPPANRSEDARRSIWRSNGFKESRRTWKAALIMQSG